MKAKREASMHRKDTERHFWVGRCVCGSARAAVERGEGDEYSRRELSESFGYVVELEPWPVKFQAHAKTCENQRGR